MGDADMPMLGALVNGKRTAIYAVCFVASLFVHRSARADIVEVDSFAQEAAESEQEMSQWCWAASIRAVLKHYKIERSQASIVEATYGRLVNLPAFGPNVLYRTLNNFIIGDDQLEVIRGNYGAGAPPPILLLSEISSGHPVIAWYTNPDGQGGHSVVIYAVNFVRTLQGPLISHLGYFDPWPGTGNKIVAAADLARLMNVYWVIRGVVLKKSKTLPKTTPTTEDNDTLEKDARSTSTDYRPLRKDEMCASIEMLVKDLPDFGRFSRAQVVRRRRRNADTLQGLYDNTWNMELYCVHVLGQFDLPEHI